LYFHNFFQSIAKRYRHGWVFETGMSNEASRGARRKKSLVALHWSGRPCNSWLAPGAEPGSPEYFERTEAERHRLEPFVARFARYQDWKGKSVLEVGCGIGFDLCQFARSGARAVGVDLTAAGAALSTQRLRHHHAPGQALVADCEQLPFVDATFDFVYSWGVIHHTPDTDKAAREIVRVVKPGGQVTVMIYNRRSLVALQAYLVYGLLKGRPLRRIAEIIATHLESPGTKAYTVREARGLFPSLEDVSITSVVTPYDLRIGRNRYLPHWVGSIMPQSLGYFMVIQGKKPRLERSLSESVIDAA
jgi:ubiquinone/menaquinone biosynthesis C-methylase UbiE